MDEDIVSVDDLKRCSECLVSVETESGEIYQGRVADVYDEMSTLVLLRPFKTGRPMNAPKFPLYINQNDIVKIIEPAISQPAPSVTKSTASQRQAQKQKPGDLNQHFREAMQSLTSSPPKAPEQPRQYTALELLNRAQAKNATQGSQNIVNIPMPANGLALLQRPQNSAKTPQSNGGGPSGNPIMDLLSGHIRKGKQHAFDQPINMDELKQDFDFSENLEHFNSQENDNQFDNLDDFRTMDGEDYRVVYEDKTAPNFRHDENIISDPKRVSSWVNKIPAKTKSLPQNQRSSPKNPTAALIGNQKYNLLQNTPTSVVSTSTPAKNQKQLTSNKKSFNSNPTDNNGLVDEYNSLKLKAFSVVPTDNGALLPILKKSEKQNLLEATTRIYNEHIFSIVLADRFTEYVFDFQKRYSINSKEVVIVAGQSCNSIVLHRFMQYFYNRGCSLHIYDPPKIPGRLENKIKIYRNVCDLPTEVPAVYMLCAQTFHSDEELRRWILKLSRPGQANPSATTHGQRVLLNKSNYPRIVALDFRLFDVKYMHTLYLGAADDSATSTGRIQNSSNDSVICTFEAYVADLGIPYSWISSADATPMDAFRNSLTCRLITT